MSDPGDDDLLPDLPALPELPALPDLPALAGGAGPPPGPAAAGGPTPTMYPDVAAWVGDFLVVVYARPVDTQNRQQTFHWCRRWWTHPEALDRLEALWRAWEALRLDPGTGPAIWWKDYADPAMRALLDEHGPFGKCRNGLHVTPDKLVPPLPVDHPDPALFPAAH